MRVIKLLIFVFFTNYGWGQTTYNSNRTIHVPQEISENIQRIITIRQEFVHIQSYVGQINVNNQAWKIHKSWEEEGNRVIHLISLDESHSIRMHIKKVNPQFIEVHQPSENGGIERLHLILEMFE